MADASAAAQHDENSVLPAERKGDFSHRLGNAKSHVGTLFACRIYRRAAKHRHNHMGILQECAIHPTERPRHGASILRATAAAPMVSHPIRVFLVEDSAILRERLVEMLAAGGVAEIVGQAETEAAAETALQTQEWDVLILDLQLLQGSGMGLLRSLASHRKPGTVVIVLTNYPIPLYRSRSMQLGADYFFDKAHEFVHVRNVLTELARKRTPACQPR